MKAILLLFPLTLLSCKPAQGDGPAPVPVTALPDRQDPDHPDPLVDAIQVWKLGPSYLEPTLSIEDRHEVSVFIGAVDSDFTRIGAPATRAFLENPWLKHAVEFGCVRSPHGFEESLEGELKQSRGVFQLQALVLLMRASAPASVDLQWKALQDLKEQAGPPRMRALLKDLEAQFSEKAILCGLQFPVPEERFRDDPVLSWNIRAAGVIRFHGALPTLVRFSRCENLDISLAAERSLEDFEGSEGDGALAQCLLGWQYDAYVRAGQALLKRNKLLLVRTLQPASPPDKCRTWQGVLLARADEPAAVPILCEEVGRRAVIDREMFDQIERLAREEDMALIQTLPQRVRPEQSDRALRLVETLNAKFAPK